ncbi:MAG: DUF3237 family protein [Firmicutes bacterium]|nr:DUF3237 family protein [Bacillota bacterium]
MKKIFALNWKRGQEYILEDTDIGYVVIFATAGGDFSGQLNGIIEPVGSGITLCTKDDDNNDVKFDMVLKEENGGYIYSEGNLILNLDPDLEQSMVDGKTVDKSEYYYKGTMRFHTSEERLKFLERKIFTVDAEINKWDGVKMEIYMV